MQGLVYPSDCGTPFADICQHAARLSDVHFVYIGQSHVVALAEAGAGAAEGDFALVEIPLDRAIAAGEQVAATRRALDVVGEQGNKRAVRKAKDGSGGVFGIDVEDAVVRFETGELYDRAEQPGQVVDLMRVMYSTAAERRARGIHLAVVLPRMPVW